MAPAPLPAKVIAGQGVGVVPGVGVGGRGVGVGGGVGGWQPMLSSTRTSSMRHSPRPRRSRSRGGNASARCVPAPTEGMHELRLVSSGVTRPGGPARDWTQGVRRNRSVIPRVSANRGEIDERSAVNRNLQDSAVPSVFQIETVPEGQVSDVGRSRQKRKVYPERNRSHNREHYGTRNEADCRGRVGR